MVDRQPVLCDKGSICSSSLQNPFKVSAKSFAFLPFKLKGLSSQTFKRMSVRAKARGRGIVIGPQRFVCLEFLYKVIQPIRGPVLRDVYTVA